MRRLVNVSNRVAVPNGEPPSGGLAVGVLAAMRASGGLWFGWSGEVVPDDRSSTLPEIAIRDGIQFATIALPAELHELSYNGFANGTLWPLLHSFLDAFRYEDEEYAAYLKLNAYAAEKLTPLLDTEDIIWIHDYQLIPLAAELRARKVRAPLGFFLHVPFPGFEILRALPCAADLVESLLSYDLIGFQTSADREAFLGAVAGFWGGEYLGPGGSVVLRDRRLATGVFPIGVDVDAISQGAAHAATSAHTERMTQGLLGRRLIIGVDRLDYSKGLLERFESYRLFLEQSPEHVGNVTYLQVAPIGRQGVEAYARMRDALEKSAGRINGAFADVDWTPIRYLNRTFSHEVLIGLLRQAQVALVTPLRDGMNLVAKEFIAAQDATDPGVLVLSDRAGAACELRDALLVNPYDKRSIARALKQALAMPLGERRRRHERLLSALRAQDIHAWQERFVDSLCKAGAHQQRASSARCDA